VTLGCEAQPQACALVFGKAEHKRTRATETDTATWHWPQRAWRSPGVPPEVRPITGAPRTPTCLRIVAPSLCAKH